MQEAADLKKKAEKQEAAKNAKTPSPHIGYKKAEEYLEACRERERAATTQVENLEDLHQKARDTQEARATGQQRLKDTCHPQDMLSARDVRCVKGKQLVW
eukprot:7807331-Alexandrium_andersonii.AAC.1